MYNTVVSDLDGTLLSEDHNIDIETIKLLNLLNKKNIRIILATGRNYADAKRIAEKLNFNPEIITSNGGEVTDSNKNLVFKKVLDKNIVESLMDFDYKKHDNKTYINFIEDEIWSGIEKYDDDNKTLEWQDSNWKFYVKDKDKINTKNCDKVFFIAEHSSLLKLEAELKEKFNDEVNFAFTLPFCLEIFPKNVDKAEGLKTLSKLKRIDFDKTIAFGDGFNDVNMLRLAKLSFVMGNAHSSLKKELRELEVIDSNINKGLQKKLKEIFGV